ncbi:MAG: DUF1835 domain-containing protein [Pyrinomonadaceae bacterium]|nr:DUF1835 domain-containing protein [Pyrinomonadaceae bacterium]
MTVHLLPGDSLVETFEKCGFEGEVVVFRECLVDGPVAADGLEEFWELRSGYLGKYGSDKDYSSHVKDELVRLWNLAEGNSVNLWFEYELFCQVNLWFSIWLLRNTNAGFRVTYPKLASDEDVWKGFSYLDEGGLKASESESVKLSDDDIFLAVRLWEAFSKGNFKELLALGETQSNAFPTLKAVTEAAAEIDSRPKEVIREIMSEGKSGFGEVFGEFCKREAKYGFGDLQVKKIFDEVSEEVG